MIYTSVSQFVAWAPGGLLHSNIAGCALFASVSGSSPATAATIGTVAIPEMKKRGYDVNLTLGTIAAGGTLGILIPPSINMIVYGMLAQSSVGQLFAGGVLPGILLSGLFMAYIAIHVMLYPTLAPKETVRFSVKSSTLALVNLWPLFVLGVIIFGGIFGGIMTPTEAAAVASATAILISMILRKFNMRMLITSLSKAAETTCMVLFIIIGASILSSALARGGVPQFVIQWAADSGFSRWTLLSFVYLLYIFLGCFIDPISMLVLTASTVIPLIAALGFDLVWFGVSYVVLAEMGMITPPMGINLFVIQGISKTPISRVTAGSFPFFIMMCVGLALMTIFPSIVLFLPQLLFGG